MKMLNWADRFNIFSFLDSNRYQSEDSRFEWKLAAGALHQVAAEESLLSTIKAFHHIHPGWLFGHLSYPSATPDTTGFQPAYFFVPEVIITCNKDTISVESAAIEPDIIFNEITNAEDHHQLQPDNIHVIPRISNQEYVEAILKIKEHIQRGDCYEMNFCQEFIAENALLNPVDLYFQLTAISPNPFSALYKNDDKYCICASPERFISRTNNKIISQPIKGTAKRNNEDPVSDEAAKYGLLESEKERSENVMIVDLVRNDLSKIAKEGTVSVDELFGIYTFPQVHQMISTISCEVADDVHWTEIVEAAYPMGSMTGAPKKKVMELTERYEATPRGLFSGTIGYVCPNGDFDFNVVIRSIFYNRTDKTISFKAGGGITINSDPQAEYEESMLKAAAIRKILQPD